MSLQEIGAAYALGYAGTLVLAWVVYARRMR